MRFPAMIADGRLSFADPAGWRVALGQAKPGRYLVTLEREYEHRTLSQLRYYFGPVVQTFQRIWSPARIKLGLPPYTKQDVHSVIVQVCMGSEPGPHPGSVLPVPTRNTDTKVFAKLTDDARHMSWHDYQVRIPEPNERDEEYL